MDGDFHSYGQQRGFVPSILRTAIPAVTDSDVRRGFSSSIITDSDVCRNGAPPCDIGHQLITAAMPSDEAPLL